MATTCPVGLDRSVLKREVSAMYARVAADPDGDFHFHRGPQYAAEFLGYDAAELATLPDEATAPFAGVANPLAIGPIAAGETVLDIGSGAGTDLLLAAKRVGPTGRAIGVDMTAEMREKAKSNALKAGLAHVDVVAGEAEALPVGASSVDVVISNGVLNLTPDKEQAFAEILRVLKPGGRLHLGDIVVAEELDEDTREDIELWAG